MGVLSRTVDRISARTWSPEQIDAMIGTRRGAVLAHAADPEVRHGAASGGAVTALLESALEEGCIDAALVCRSKVNGDRVRAFFALARNREQLLAARGSKYVAVNFVRDAVPLLREFSGRVAVVGLPCDLATLARYRTRLETGIRADIAFTVGLFCGHNSTPALVDMVTDRLSRDGGQPLTEFSFRSGHWRGHTNFRFEDGRVGQAPSRTYSAYRHLSLFTERKCLSCADHFAFDADVAAGDVWLYSLRADPVKKTGILIRTEVGEDVVAAARASGLIVATDVHPTIMLDGQARIAPHHYNVAARRAAGRLLGVRISASSVPDGQRAGILARLDAFLTVAAFRISDSARGRRFIALLPLGVIRALAVAKKSLMVLAR